MMTTPIVLRGRALVVQSKQKCSTPVSALSHGRASTRARIGPELLEALAGASLFARFGPNHAVAIAPSGRHGMHAAHRFQELA